MTREILFRGKRIDNGGWINGDLITTPFIRNETQEHITYILDITKADYDCFEDLVESNGIFEVDSETVCQYTGLTDKSGRRIFENDVIECKRNNRHFQSQIEWDSICGGFMFQDTKEGSAVGLDALLNGGIYNDFKIIGNIFDNPEFVKGDIK